MANVTYAQVNTLHAKWKIRRTRVETGVVTRARARKLDEFAIAIATRLLHDDVDVDAIVRSRLLTIPRFELHTHTHTHEVTQRTISDGNTLRAVVPFIIRSRERR